MSHASGAQRSHALWLNSAQPRRVRCGNRLLACQVASSTPGLESEIPGTPAYSKGALSSDCLRRYPRPLRILLARHCAPAMWWLPRLCAALAARHHHDLPGPVGECISPNRKTISSHVAEHTGAVAPAPQTYSWSWASVFYMWDSLCQAYLA